MKTRLFTLLLSLAFCVHSTEAFAQASASDVENLISQLQTSGKGKAEIQARRDAALTLSELGPAAAAASGALALALDDGDTQVWFHSVTALSRIGAGAAPAIPALLEDLESSSRRGVNAKWYRSAHALGSMGPAALPALRDALNESNSAVRAGAAKAFTWLREEGAPAIPKLIDLLKDSEEKVRESSAEALGSIGEQALPALLATLSGEHHVARHGAVLALEHMASAAKPATDDLIALAKAHETPDLQASALRTLQRLHLDESILEPLVWSLVNHTDDGVRHEIANCILDLPPERSVPQLLKRLQFEDLATQIWAADLLGRIGPAATTAIPRLVELVNQSRHESHAKQFRQAIASLGPSAIGPLFEYLAQGTDKAPIDTDHWVVQSLGNYGIPGLSQLIAGLSHEQVQVRLAAIHAIGSLGADGRDANPRIERLLRDPAPEIRAASLLGMMSISSEPDQYASQVRVLLADDSPIARRAAALSIPYIEVSDEPTIERLGTMLQDSDPKIILATVKALGSIGEDAKTQTASLAALLSQPNPLHRISVIEALGAIGSASKETSFQIAEIIESTEGAVQLAAVRSLGQLGNRDPRLAATLRQTLKDESEELREAAIAAYGATSHDLADTFEVSLNALDDSASPVRLAAAKNLGELGAVAIPATPQLMELLSDRYTFTAILDALKKIPVDEGQYKTYREGLDHRSSGVRAFAAERLGQVGDLALPDVPKLRKMATGDSSRFVKSRARSAVERITGEDF